MGRGGEKGGGGRRVEGGRAGTEWRGGGCGEKDGEKGGFFNLMCSSYFVLLNRYRGVTGPALLVTLQASQGARTLD